MNPVRQKLLGQDPLPPETREWIEVMISAESDVWSCPVLVDSCRDRFDHERRTRLHAEVEDQRVRYVTRCRDAHDSSVIAATETIRDYADEIRGLIPNVRHYTVLGSDGHGRNGTGLNSRHFSEIDGRWIAQAAITSRDWRDGLAGHRARDRDLKTRSGHAESVDIVSTNIQWHALVKLTSVESFFAA